MNNEKFEIKETKNGVAVVAETKTYTLTIAEINNQLVNLKYQKENLIKQNEDILERFKKIETRETELQNILKTLEKNREEVTPAEIK